MDLGKGWTNVGPTDVGVDTPYSGKYVTHFRDCILKRVKNLIFEIILIFTIFSTIKILSLILSVSNIPEIFKMRISVTLLV